VIEIILDCDPGHDDAIALMLALASPEVELLGVTTVSGNHSLERTTDNAIRLLDHLGHEAVPVLAGAPRPLVREVSAPRQAHGETGLDGPDLAPAARVPTAVHATDWIAATLAARPRPVTLVATGPLTNVALLLARDSGLEPRIARIVLMGGSIGLGNGTPAAEFNIWADPEAAQRVFSSGLDVTMIGLDVTQAALLEDSHVDAVAGAGRAGRLLADLYGYGRHHRRRQGYVGVPVHDAVAVAHVIDGTLLELKDCAVVVDTGPEPSRGRTYVDLRGGAESQPACHVAVAIDSGRFLDLLVARIAGLDR
jgi:inosine-uridine nucleoside N-ribohydrolase